MPVPAILGAAAPIVGGLVGKAIGGGGPKNAQPALPKDLQGMRGSNIGLLNYLLGFQQQNQPWSQQQPPASQGGPIQRPGNSGTGLGPGGSPYQIGGAGQMGGGSPYGMPSFNMGGMGGGVGSRNDGSWLAQQMQGQGGGIQGYGDPGRMPTGGFQQQPQGFGDPGRMNPGSFSGGGAPQGYGDPGRMNPGAFGGGMPQIAQESPMMNGGGGSNPMLQRMESYFGPLGTPTTALQQQSLGGISQFLNSNPYGQSNNALSQIMGTKPQDYFGGAQNAYGKVAGANYFGGAQDAFKGLQNGNFFGNAQKGFDQLAQGNYYGDADQSFKQLQNYNPFQPAQGALEQMFAQNPGQGTMQAMDPLYQRALAQANQEGGRFGSANAILRSRALDDHALMMQQALQHGVDQQIAAAGQYGSMGNSLIGAKTAAGQGLLGVGNGRMQQQSNAAQGQLGIGQGRMQQQGDAARGFLGVGQGRLDQGLGVAQGLTNIGQGRSNYQNQFMGNQINAAGQMGQNANNYFGNMQGAYQTGSQQAVQENLRQQQALQILMGQLGVSQGATLGADNVVTPTGAQQGAQMGGGIGQILAMLAGGQGGGGAQAFSNPGAAAPSFGIPYGFGGDGNMQPWAQGHGVAY